MKKLGLVLEGGGMRGAYTAGVLDWLLENEIYFDYVVGISSGALYATMYAQKDRNALREASIEIAADKRNVGMKAIMAEKTIVGYNFLFDQIKNKSKFDLTKQNDTEIKVEIGVYDINEQETIWVNSEEIAEHPKMVQAACTLPIFGRAVNIDGKPYMDGGVTTMIPIERSLEAGCENLQSLSVTLKAEQMFTMKSAHKLKSWNKKAKPYTCIHLKNSVSQDLKETKNSSRVSLIPQEEIVKLEKKPS